MNQKALFEIKKFKTGVVFFTDRKKNANFSAIINNLPKKAIIIVREYDLDYQSRKNFAQKIINLAKTGNQKVLIGKNIKLAQELKADGIHFSDNDKLPLQFYKKSSFKQNFIFSLASHNLRSLLKLQKLQPKLLFISPIFKTTSHIDAKNIGLTKLAEISFKLKKDKYHRDNIYALGGVSLSNVASIRKLKLSGFGAIDFFMR